VPVALAVTAIALAGLSLLVPAAPDYDAWAYLIWGRELGRLELSTVDGPAFKPLPVAVCTLLAPLGAAAPDAWLAVARAGALAAVALAGLLAAQLAAPGRRWLAALCAGAGVALTGGFLRHAAVGDAEPLLVALALGAWQRHRAGRPGQAAALATAAALVRVETWPFAAAYALHRARSGPRGASAPPRVPGRSRRRRRHALAPRLDRRVALAAVGLGALTLAAWLGPELAGSGQLLRSGDRALVPNPGAPALADRPFLASLGQAAALLPLPLAAAALAAPRGAARLPALAGAAWCLLVAVMAEAGFSGEPRYALPGVALVAVSAGVGAARLAGAVGRRAGTPPTTRRAGAVGRHAGTTSTRTLAGAVGLRRAAPAAAAAVLLLPTAGLAVGELRPLPGRLRAHAQLVADLDAAIARAGGREAILACGRPAVGRYRGTLAAHALDVPKRVVRADGRPDAVTLRSRLVPGAALSPPSPPGARLLAAAGRWRIEAGAGCLTGRASGDRSGGRAR
jgi:hypothetical protein